MEGNVGAVPLGGKNASQEKKKGSIKNVSKK